MFAMKGLHGLTVLPAAFCLIWCTATAAFAQEADDRILELANGFYDQQLWAEALAEYEKFIVANPDFPELAAVLLAAGESAYNLEQFADAVGYYQRITDEFAESPEVQAAWFRLGECRSKLGDYQGAATAFENLLQLEPDTALVYKAAYWLGEARFALNDYTGAVAAYEQCLAHSPDEGYEVFARYSIGYTLITAGEVAQGIVHLEQLLTLFPGHELSPEIHYRLGRAYYSEKDHDAALTHFEVIVANHPDSSFTPLALSGIGWVHWDREEYAAALEHFTAAAGYEESPAAVEAAQRAADCLFVLERFDEAAGAYQSLADNQANPEAGAALYWLAVSLERLGDSAKARETLELFIDRFPDHNYLAEAYLHLAGILIEAGEVEQAARHYRQVIENTTDPRLQEQGRYGAAWAEYQLNRSEEALAEIEKLAFEKPESDMAAHVALETGKLRFNRGEYEAAAKLLTLLIEHHEQIPAIAEVLYLLGVSYEKLENTQEAEAFLRRVMEDHATSEAAIKAAARLVAHFAAQGRLPQAREIMDFIREHNPQAAEAGSAAFALAEALLSDRKFREAAEEYASVLKTAAGTLAPFARYGLAAAKLATSEFPEAARLLREVIAEEPAGETAINARFHLALALSRMGEHNEAVHGFEAFVKDYPDHELVPRALLELGWLHSELKQPQEALAVFERLAAEYPNSRYVDEALFRIGELRYDQGNFPAAQAAYEQVLADYPESEILGEAAYKLGWALIKQNKRDEAIEPLLLAAEKAADPAVAADARFHAATWLLKKQQYADVAALLQPALEGELNEQNAPLAVLTGQAGLGLSDWDGAEQMFQRVIDTVPATAAALQAQIGLGRVHKGRGDTAQALETFKSLTASSDRRIALEAQFELADTHRQAGDLRTAALEYLKVAILYDDADWAVRSQYAAGLCFEQMGATEDAARAYKVITERYKEHTEWVEKAETRLQQLRQGP